ncbi:sulfotransferase 1E1 [Trichonephila clavata]|uniref:Sulfotransferase 1E1 n=1 Tax=Trichonephila clavata TaxID=2740835 RepID=A0A8X6F2C6_TRICU|nr:sulfotransferase 1E1 [Trichonephila clavata]
MDHFEESDQFNDTAILEHAPKFIQARPDDIFIATYPKCGTTWAQHILILILNHGTPLTSHSIFFGAAPFLELSGAKAVEEMPRPGAIKIHLPFRLAPWSEQAKYIHITRNPKDVCVSYYYHMKDTPVHGFKGSFDEFFDIFLSGNIDFGDYFEHLLGWYEHRNDPNVLFLTYEAMLENTAEAILKIASFLDDAKYAEPLRQDPEKLNNVLKYSSFKHMKESVNSTISDIVKMTPDEIAKSDLPDTMKNIFSQIPKEHLPDDGSPPPVNFIRKGIIGDWRNHLSEDQSKRMDQKFAERTKGTDIPNLWKNYM